MHFLIKSCTGFLYFAIVLTAGAAPLSTAGLRLQPGPYTVGKQDFRLVDNSRTTAAHNGEPEAAERTLATTVWYPGVNRPLEWLRPGPRPLARQACPAPLVIYSHGFLSFRGNGAYLAKYLASHGYIVAAADFPLTGFGTAGGPQFTDVLNQPGDVSFVIDSLLAWNNASGNRFAGCLDPERIGAVGLSLGGMTTTLLAFHPEFRDPRIQAAVSIAGPVALLGKDFFSTSSTHYMMIAADIDAMIDYRQNGAQIRTWAPDATLVTLHGGSHTGFAGIAAPLLRWFDNPDSVGCRAIRGALDDAPDMPENFMSELRGQAGEKPAAPELPPCHDPELPTALHPRHQQTLTKHAIFSFLQGHLHPDAGIRHEYSRILEQSLALENPELEVASGQ